MGIHKLKVASSEFNSVVNQLITRFTVCFREVRLYYFGNQKFVGHQLKRE